MGSGKRTSEEGGWLWTRKLLERVGLHPRRRVRGLSDPKTELDPPPASVSAAAAQEPQPANSEQAQRARLRNELYATELD